MRVNVIHPKYLADQHLVAEYREIHPAPEGDSWLCWNCCKKIPTDTQKMRYY